MFQTDIFAQEPRIFFRIPASVADAATVDPNGIKMLLANGLRIFSINGNPTFKSGLRNLLRNLLGDTLIDNWVFENLVLANELLVKALPSFETCYQFLITQTERYFDH